MKKTAVLTLFFTVIMCAVVCAQTTVTTVPAQGTTIVTGTGSLHEVPGGFPEGRPAAVDTYIPPQTVVQTQVINGNAGNFQSGFYAGSTGTVIQTTEIITPAYPRYSDRYYRRSYRVPGGRMYETIENRGIVTETQTVLQ